MHWLRKIYHMRQHNQNICKRLNALMVIGRTQLSCHVIHNPHLSQSRDHHETSLSRSKIGVCQMMSLKAPLWFREVFANTSYLPSCSTNVLMY